jgi:hypothetical protein
MKEAAAACKAGEEKVVVIKDFRADIVYSFVQMVLFGDYTDPDPLEDKMEIRHSAEVWVFGEFLGSTKLQDKAMRKLHRNYFPPNPDAKVHPLFRPLGHALAEPPICGGLGPQAIGHCLSKTPKNSKLRVLFLDVLIFFWDRNDVIEYTQAEQAEWSSIWDEHPAFRNQVLYWSGQPQAQRNSARRPVEVYLKDPPPKNPRR